METAFDAKMEEEGRKRVSEDKSLSERRKERAAVDAQHLT